MTTLYLTRESIAMRVKQFLASGAGIFTYALVTGGVGIFLLLAFTTLLFGSANLVLILPAIVAFNAAASGFSVVDRGKTTTRESLASLAILMLLLATMGTLSLALFAPWESFFEMKRFMINTFAALAGSLSGAWVASKNNAIKRSS